MFILVFDRVIRKKKSYMFVFETFCVMFLASILTELLSLELNV